jgi:hypothetical protein
MRNRWWLLVVLGAAIGLGRAQEPQVSPAQLYGRIADVGGHPVAAKVVARDGKTGRATTSIATQADGAYRLSNLAAGLYAVEAQAEGFETSPSHMVSLAAGQQVEVSFSLTPAGTESMRLSVDSAAEQMSGDRVGGEFEVTKRLIDNLPIDGRNYVQFSLTDSQVKRDSAPGISDLPASGLSINGQRARFNLVNVDGGNAEDSVSNGISSTVSQEAVQEFSILTDSFAPEYGQALGGVVNVVTRGGGNNWHGDVYGYLRNRNFAAVNPLSNVSNPAYTRVQPGLVLGGPIKKDRTYFFFSYETTRRQETGFSTIGVGNFGLVNIDASRFFGPGAVIQGTPEQQAFLTDPATPVNPQTMAYAALVAGGSGVALKGVQPAFLGGAATFPTSGAPLPASFTPLGLVGGNFPVSEGTSIWSLRIDHRLTEAQQFMVRATVSPSTIKGIQSSGPSGSTAGLTSFARSVQQQYRDFNILATHVTTMGADKVNEVRFLASRRGLSFASAQGAGADVGDPGVDLPGYAYIGEDPLSPLSYVEKRFQGLDQLSWTHGPHSFKFGGEFTDIPVSTTETVQGGGDYIFGDTILSPGLPAFSTVQSYGLGLPLSFLQSIGVGEASYSNRRIGFFAQDSWTLNSRLKFNYGLRYDAEFNPESTPGTAMATVAEQALGVRGSLPFDGHAIAPRVGIAWDPAGDGKTVIKAGYGMFYDHPPSGVNAYASIYDGTKVPLLLLTGGTPCPVAGGSTNPFNLSATNEFQGTLTNSNCYGPLPGYVPSQQRFNPTDPGAIALFSQQGYLSSGVPLPEQPMGQVISTRFRYPLSQQASLRIEHQLGSNYIVSLGYLFNGGHRLFQPIDVNAANGTALVDNWERAVAAGAVTPRSSPYAVASCGVGPVGAFAPAALLSFFRPSGINPSLTTAFAPCMPLAQQVAEQFGLGTGNPPIPFSDMDALSSTATSAYHGFTASLRRRMGEHYQFQTSYTWSHAIDDADDFYVPPQNSLDPRADRSNSSLDQRHRFVFSGIYQSGKVADGKGWDRLVSNWTLAPVIEIASGTPFNLLLGTSYNSRPGVAASAAQTDLCGDTAVASRYSPTGYLIAPCTNDGVYDGKATLPFYGTLGRNAGTMPMTAFTDLRISRRIGLSERFHLDASADVFNAINRFNVSGVNTLYSMAGTPTAAFDPRVLQLGMKVSW